MASHSERTPFFDATFGEPPDNIVLWERFSHPGRLTLFQNRYYQQWLRISRESRTIKLSCHSLFLPYPRAHGRSGWRSCRSRLAFARLPHLRKSLLLAFPDLRGQPQRLQRTLVAYLRLIIEIVVLSALTLKCGESLDHAIV